MKKIYVLLMLLPLFSLKAQTVPSCSINPTFIHNHGEGIWPDSALNFVSGTVGQPYVQNITVNVPLDTTVSGFPCTYSYFQLNSSTNNYGLPSGLSLACTAHTNFQFPGNDSTCMIIYGTPTTAGSYTLTFVIGVYCTAIPGTALATKTLSYYIINIAAATGIETNTANSVFQVMQNNPNPVVSSTTNVKFTTPTDGKAKMTVFNITGQKIADKDIVVQRGENNYDFDATTLENGIYLYSIEFNGQKQIRRMVVAK